MNSNLRYCMKCGNSNYNHSANANMKNYIKNDNSSYQVGSGRLIVGNDSNQTMTILQFFLWYFNSLFSYCILILSFLISIYICKM